jgi:hypothetical protein
VLPRDAVPAFIVGQLQDVCLMEGLLVVVPGSRGRPSSTSSCPGWKSTEVWSRQGCRCDEARRAGCAVSLQNPLRLQRSLRSSSTRPGRYRTVSLRRQKARRSAAPRVFGSGPAIQALSLSADRPNESPAGRRAFSGTGWGRKHGLIRRACAAPSFARSAYASA